jgi:ferric-dicitrate binding protein FerR (iron transport regulator)
MAFCKIVDLFYAAIPSRTVRDWLIRGHADGCERCRARLASREEARALLVKPEDAGAPGDLWRLVEPQSVWAAVPAAPERPSGRRREWAAGAAAFLVFAAAGFWLLRGLQNGRPEAGAARVTVPFEINYINVGGSPAQTFIYQPQGSDMIIIWAERTS